MFDPKKQISLGQLDSLVTTLQENETLAKHITDDRKTLKAKLENITEAEKKRIHYLRFNKYYSLLLKDLKQKYDIN
jgi:plasmid maintenance system killer protein